MQYSPFTPCLVIDIYETICGEFKDETVEVAPHMRYQECIFDNCNFTDINNVKFVACKFNGCSELNIVGPTELIRCVFSRQ